MAKAGSGRTRTLATVTVPVTSLRLDIALHLGWVGLSPRIHPDTGCTDRSITSSTSIRSAARAQVASFSLVCLCASLKSPLTITQPPAELSCRTRLLKATTFHIRHRGPSWESQFRVHILTTTIEFKATVRVENPPRPARLSRCRRWISQSTACVSCLSLRKRDKKPRTTPEDS